MRESDARPTDEQPDLELTDPTGELSDADLECVVGGLARPWTEAETDDWLTEPPVRVL